MLMAMIDGIQNRIDPVQAARRDIYEMTRVEMQHLEFARRPVRSRKRSMLSNGIMISDSAAMCSPKT